MTLWSKEEAERWPIETKIMVDMALDAGREVKVVEDERPEAKFLKLLDAQDARDAGRVDYPNGSWIPNLWCTEWPSDSVGATSLFGLEASTYLDFGYNPPRPIRLQRKIGQTFEAPIDLSTPSERRKRHHANLVAARQQTRLDGRRRR